MFHWVVYIMEVDANLMHFALVVLIDHSEINHLRPGNLRSRRATQKINLLEAHAIEYLAFVTSIDRHFDGGSFDYDPG